MNATCLHVDAPSDTVLSYDMPVEIKPVVRQLIPLLAGHFASFAPDTSGGIREKNLCTSMRHPRPVSALNPEPLPPIPPECGKELLPFAAAVFKRRSRSVRGHAGIFDRQNHGAGIGTGYATAK